MSIFAIESFGHHRIFFRAGAGLDYFFGLFCLRNFFFLDSGFCQNFLDLFDIVGVVDGPDGVHVLFFDAFYGHEFTIGLGDDLFRLKTGGAKSFCHMDG